MAQLTVNGLEELMNDLNAVSELPDGVAYEMLNSQADVLVLAQKKQIMDDDLIDSGQLFASIDKTSVKHEAASRYIEVYPQGKRRDGVRNTEVGFILEYGRPKREIPAKHWMKQANEGCAERTTEAARKVYDEYLKTRNL